MPAVAVELEDATGARVSGASASVSIHLLGGGSAGSLIGATTRRPRRGGHLFRPRSSAAGGYSLVATSAELDSAVSRDFLVTRAATDRWVEVGTASQVLQFRSTTNGTVNPAVDTIAAGDLIIWSWLDDGHSVHQPAAPASRAAPS